MMLAGVRTMSQEQATRDLVGEPAEHAACWTREEFSRQAEAVSAPLFRLCLALCRSRDDAEDLLQNALVKAFIHRASYRGDAPFLSWLYGIVRNERAETVRMLARRRGLLRGALERFGVLFEDLTASAETSPEDNIIHHENADLVVARVQDLPEPYREVVWMCDIEELSYEDIAAALSIPIGTVKSRHARGRVRLRELLARGGEGNAGPNP